MHQEVEFDRTMHNALLHPVITSGIGGQPGTLIIGLPDTTEDTDTVFVGFGLAA